MYENNEIIVNICRSIFGSKYAIKSLAGGINNSVYLIYHDKKSYVLKKFNVKQTPIFDRYKAEKQFLTLTSNLGYKNTPKIIDSFDDLRILLLEYIKPDKVGKSFVIDLDEIHQCINFINSLNSNLPICKSLITQKAADCYMDLEGHISNIDFRINQFGTEHLPYKLLLNARKLLKVLNIKWEILKNESLRIISDNQFINSINEESLIISPSDFGFHNIIIKEGQLFFIDFEFSGWDDPGKMYCDFMLQPKFPIEKKFNLILKESFLNKEYIDSYGMRLFILYKLLRFKWHTINHSYLNPNKNISNINNLINLTDFELENF